MDLSSLFGGNSTVTIIILYAAIGLALYFFLIRPQSKKKKKEEELRNNVKIGDTITTIGGIVGRVVSVKEDGDTLIIETGVDRSKVKLRKWAIASCDTEKEEEKKQDSKSKKQ